MDVEWICLNAFSPPTVENYWPQSKYSSVNIIPFTACINWIPSSSCSVLRGRSGTSWCSSSSHRKWVRAPAQLRRASQRWTTPHKYWINNHAGSEALQTCFPPPAPTDGQTQTDACTDEKTDGQTDGRTGERHTDPAIDRERHKEGGIMPRCQRERLAFRGGEMAKIKRWNESKRGIR